MNDERKRQAEEAAEKKPEHDWKMEPNAANSYCRKCGYFPGPPILRKNARGCDADSTPPQQEGDDSHSIQKPGSDQNEKHSDDEFYKRINYFVWNYCDRDQRLTAESAFAQVLCDALNNARRTQAERMIRLQNANDGLKKVVSHYFAEIERLKKELEWHRTQHGKDLVKTVGDVHGVLVSENQELRALLERAMKYIKLCGDTHDIRNSDFDTSVKLLSDYSKLTSNAAQGGDGEV